MSWCAAMRSDRLKGWERFQRHVHMGIIGMNLLYLLDKKHRRLAEEAAAA